MTTNHSNGQLLPFNRTGAEVRALAERQREQGQYLTALDLLRPSLEKAYDAETVLMIAEIYAEMGCWTASNSAFFSLAHEEAYAEQCFFGLGFNLYKLQDYTAARDCFMLVLQKEPNGFYAPDAAELLDIIEEASEPLDPRDIRLQQRMERVLDAMDKGNAGLAKRQIRRVISLGGSKNGIRSLQAFAMLADGDAKGALQAARMSLRTEPHDVRSLCAMASALKANLSMDAARAYLRRAAQQIGQEDDVRLVAQTACEMEEHAFVVELMNVAERHDPNNEEVLRTLAFALHNIGDAEGAVRRWRVLRRLDPADTIAAYWLDMAEKGDLPEKLSYVYQVPLVETLLRLRRLGEWVHEGREAMLARWQADDELSSLLRWALASGETGIPRVACNLLSTIEDPGAEVLLREVLCDLNASADLKQSALTALYAMHAKEPFYAIMEDRLTLVHVSKASDDKAAERAQLREAFQAAADRWLKLTEEPHDEALLGQLYEAALSLDGGGLSADMRGRAVVMVYCWLTHRQSPFSSTMPSRRKIERLARRIMKEAEHAVH